MNASVRSDSIAFSSLARLLLALALALLLATPAFSFTLEVVTKDGAPIASGFRWLLEEDNTNQSPPGVPTANSIGLDIHKSHAPAVATGNSAGVASTSVTVPDAVLPYFISVLPDSGYAMGGAPVAAGADTVRVIVASYPLPTAQISVLVFEDNYSINNAADLPNERGLEGFTIVVHDNGGQMMQDAFGNMLGTTYQTNPDGSFVLVDGAPVVAMMGTGNIRSDVNGEALVKFLPPGKYGIQVIPPTLDPVSGDPVSWIQTATIEGTPTIDAWVVADEPTFSTEGFGNAFKHVAFGFVDPSTLPWAQTPPVGFTGSISGRVAYNHFSRPPTTQGFFAGAPVAECMVGLNDPVTGEGLIVVPCDDESNFTIDGIPPGTYQLVTWDKPLLALFGINTVTVLPGAGTGEVVDLGNVLSFRWFGTFAGTVFYDSDGDGFRDPGESGMAEQNVNIRFRDGTIYQSQPTDVFGEYELSGVFPFFKWLVTEVDFARFKATGMTAVVDYGGAVDPVYDAVDTSGWDPRAVGVLHPQPQASVNPNTGNNLSRTETGPVLTQAMHLFLNQTNLTDWGKQAYAVGENGGISGIVYYAVTRAENDPRYAVGEPWEPGIPRVQVSLYQDNRDNVSGLRVPDGVIDDLDGDGGPTLSDVDNYPAGNFPGIEDIDHNGNGAFDAGDAIQITLTDSWDEAPPTGCIQTLPVIGGQPAAECFDNFGTWNQIRPGVFDGGYAFSSYVPGGIVSGRAEVDGLPTGSYIVEAANPRPGVYELLKEESKNVDFGDSYTPSLLLLPPYCVGDDHPVPAELTLFPGVEVDPSLAGTVRPLCDRKAVVVSDGDNTAADFFYFTEVPKAARAVGFANNDLSAEFDPTSPIFGEKAAPAWIPVSFRDWQGNEITRVYTDQFGSYNALLPSSYTVNIPSPSGVAPNMLTLVLNDPGPIPDPANPGALIVDPHYDERYSVTPWTFNYETGRTSYLDTPLVPVAAFVTVPAGELDKAAPDGTPVIASVFGADPDFALVCTDTVPPGSLPTLTITAVDTSAAGRDSGFGAVEGSVLIDGSSAGIVVASWTATEIVITIDPAVVAGGLLRVVRGDNGRATETGANVVVADCSAPTIHRVSGGSVYPVGKIQAAIDAAAPGDLILVGPGDYYENLILWKPIRLQGAGATSTRIQGTPNPAARLAAWYQAFITLGLGDPQAANEAPGIVVLGSPGDAVRDFSSAPSLIDGFTLLGSLGGGGIHVSRDAVNLQISNNDVRNNQGNWGGGITVGIPDTGTPGNNSGVRILNNRIAANGGIFGPGGIAIYSGSDDYLVSGNRITANFSRYSGGGIGHVGLSPGGVIAENKILFNEVFYGQLVAGTGLGGGILISGEVPPVPNPPLTEGAGSLTVAGNLIQGNLAGAGSGGGIAAFAVNGQDVTGDPSTWHTLTLVNNIIVNNVAAQGGRISLQDVTAATIVNNTVAYNDSTSTTAAAFPAGNLDVSTPLAGGILSFGHSLQLGAIPLFTQTYSDPLLTNNILWHNRSFFNDAGLNGNGGGLLPASQHALSDPLDSTVYPDFWDLQVAGAVGTLNPTFSILSDGTGYDPSNLAQDPGMVRGYLNRLQSSAVLDEGGNAISVRYTPLSESAGDYHLLTACSPAVDNGQSVDPGTVPGIVADYDREDRPHPDTALVDIGADEFYQGASTATVLTLLQPNGGEMIPAGSSYPIRWAAPDYGVPTTYTLAYSTGPGSPFRLIERDVTATCTNWAVPGDIHSSTMRLAIVASDGAATLDRAVSAAPFTVDVIALQAPNGGETLLGGGTYSITWSSAYAPAPVASVGLWYQTAAGAPWVPIATTIDSGRYDWLLPALSSTSTTARVALILYDGNGKPLLTDLSDGTFTLVAASPVAASPVAVAAALDPVVPLGVSSPSPLLPAAVTLSVSETTVTPPTLELLVPQGGEIFTAGEIVPLLWLSPPSPQVVAGVEVAFSSDGGATWRTVVTLETDTEYLEWQVPEVAAPLEGGLIEVRRLDGEGKVIDSDRSDDVFTIVPAN